MQHVVVIDPGVRVLEVEAFNHLALSVGVPLTYHPVVARDAESLAFEDLGEVAGVIIFGSGASVHDGLSWQGPMNQWLEEAASRKIGIIGICYGHQLLAHLFGGEVSKRPESSPKYTGFRSITAQLPGPGGFEFEGDLVVSHRDEVVKVPDGWVGIPSKDGSIVEVIYALDKQMVGIQAHPEAGPAFMAHLDMGSFVFPNCFDDGQRLLANMMSWCGMVGRN